MLTIALLTAGALSGPPVAVDDGAKWHADFDEAAKVAREEGKDLLVDFTGSDWCPPCIKLHDQVLTNDAFLSAVSDKFVLVALDFPRNDEAKAKVPNPERNRELAKMYGVTGYPTVMMMTADGLDYGRIVGYGGAGVDAYLEKATAQLEQRPEGAVKLEVGSNVPAGVMLRDLDGEAHSFGQLRGKTVIVHFWSDRCPAERHANPIFKSMEERYADDEDVVMIGIASNKNELGDEPGDDADHSELYKNLRDKIAEVGYEHTILADHGNRVADMFQAQTTPHCFVIDPEGVVQYAGALDDDPRGRKGDEATNYVADAVAAIAEGEKPETQSTRPYG